MKKSGIICVPKTELVQADVSFVVGTQSIDLHMLRAAAARRQLLEIYFRVSAGTLSFTLTDRIISLPVRHGSNVKR